MKIITIFAIYIACINIFAYAIMWIDKIKSIYKKWRVSERFLWILAIFGGVFGIFLGMQAPLYHKAGKNIFKIFIPIVMLFWIFAIIFAIKNF